MAPQDKEDDEENDFAKALAEFEREQPQQQGGKKGKRKELALGELVRARVVSIGQEAVFVDLGAKAEGMIDLAEVRDDAGKITVKVGDELEARVVETAGGKSGCVVLRRSIGKGPQAKAELESAFAHGIPVDGVVGAVNKGGVEVTIAGERAFCPISQLDLRHVEDAAPYVGQKFQFRITRYEVTGRNVNLVVSRRALLEEEQASRAAATREKLAVGAVLSGTVTSLKDYGAFVDLGGLEGMIHVSELGFARVAHPREVLSPGQPVEVQVLRIEPGDGKKQGEKIALSLKSLEKDPWSGVPELFPAGRRVEGKIVRLELYGAFVEIAPGVEGLVHVSELGAGRHIQHPREVVKVGQTVEVTVLAVDRDKRRVSLSMNDRGDDVDAEGARLATSPSGSGATLADLISKNAQSKQQKKKKK
jgi:small subunit ribosomal protein S1